MILLDIIDVPHRERIIKPIKEVVIDTIDTVRDTVTDVEEAVADSVSSSQVMINGTGTPTNDSPTLLMAIVVIAAALALCAYAAYKSRRRRLAV